MACKYCADYIARGLKDVENFEKACEALRLDPHKQSDWEAIVRAMVMIGQFGTIRLARRFPFVTAEKTFLMVARTALNFYWMTLDFWEDKLVIERQKRKEADEKAAADLQAHIDAKIKEHEKARAAFLEQFRIKG